MESGPNRIRLSAMMFGQYVIIGAWSVPLATYMRALPSEGGLGFSATQISWIYSASAFVGLFAPLMLGLLADRLFAAQRLLGILHLAGAGILFAAGRFCAGQQPLLVQATNTDAATQHTFSVLMSLMLLNAFVMVISIALCNIVAFRNLKEPKKNFSRIRLFGTIAWIVVNIGLDLFGNALSEQQFYVGAACSLVMGIYAFSLPHTPPARSGKGAAAALGLPALKMFKDPSFRVLLLCAMFMAAIQQFYSVWTNPFLRSLEVAKPTALQTIAQFSEVIFMLVMPMVLLRFGFKTTLFVGIVGWTVRNAIFATGYLPAVAGLALPLHGMCYTFFFIVANVYVDRHAPNHLRAAAQGIYTFTSMGVGTLLGNGLSALAMNHTTGIAHAWTWFWLVPTVASVCVLIGFTTFFHEAEVAAEVPSPAPAAPITPPAPSDSILRNSGQVAAAA
jgi:nucleoside transporter